MSEGAEPTAEPSEESPEAGTASPSGWVTGPPEVELEEQEGVFGLWEEELPHMLLPDSLSQLEEFGRHKRPRKAHRGHGRPRLFSDLWVRIGDGWDITLIWTCEMWMAASESLKVQFIQLDNWIGMWKHEKQFTHTNNLFSCCLRILRNSMGKVHKVLLYNALDRQGSVSW